ncbi:sensor histidine kinase [Bacillus sp. NPDC077027]|uniref:sensor histidine kinase n=1 Tax=Bacillus sp. NPDC077027 TaxID=3390548 RepID=UPI003D01F5D3
MRLKNKIQLYTSLSLFLMILFIHTAIYFIFSFTLTQKDMSRLSEVAENIAIALKKSEEEGLPSSELLRAYLPQNGMIRIVTVENKSSLTITKDSSFSSLPFTYESGQIVDIKEYQQHMVAYAAIPVIWTNGDIVSLQVYEEIENTEENLALLKIILISAGLSFIVLSYFAGHFLTKQIVRPISRMTNTMKDSMNEKAFKRIELKSDSKDELYQMGQTFNQMAEILEKHYEKEQQFLHDASHELKTPITVIMSYSNLLRRWGQKRPEVLEESSQAIHEEAKKMKRLTDQLLTLAKNGQPIYLDIQKVMLTEVCKQVINTLEVATNRTIRIHHQGTDRELFTIGDEEKIKQLITILIDNAVKYSDQPVDVTCGLDEDRPFISVSDKGIGIGQVDQPKIFDRFFRVDEARNSETGGTGLGLSIAKQIADEHEAELKVESQVGEGTTMTILFRKMN